MSTSEVKEQSFSEKGGEKAHLQEKYHLDKLGDLSLILGVLLALGLGMLILLTLMFRLQHPSPVFFQASERGELIPPTSLETPNMASNALLNWVTEAMMDSFTINYIDYGSVGTNVKQYFTPEGFDSYVEAVKTSILDTLIKNKFVLRAKPDGAPQIIKEGILANRYLWKIKLKMDFSYRSFSGVLDEDAEIILIVMRVPNNESPFGIKILKLDLTVKQGAP